MNEPFGTEKHPRACDKYRVSGASPIGVDSEYSTTLSLLTCINLGGLPVLRGKSLNLLYRTRATIEVHLFFSEVPQFGSSRPLPKIDLEKN